MRRLDRLHLGRHVEAEQPCEFGAGDPDPLAGQQGGLPAAGEVGLGPGRLQRRDEPLVELAEAVGDRLGTPLRLAGAGPVAARLFQVEVGGRHGEERVVGRGAQVGLPGAEHLPGGQRGEDRVVRGDDRGRPDAGADAEHEPAFAGGEDVPGDVLDAAVVPVVVHPGGDGRHPQDASLVERRGGDPDPLGGQRDVEGAGVGELQVDRQRDRQRPVGGGRRRFGVLGGGDGGKNEDRQRDGTRPSRGRRPG